MRRLLLSVLAFCISGILTAQVHLTLDPKEIKDHSTNKALDTIEINKEYKALVRVFNKGKDTLKAGDRLMLHYKAGEYVKEQAYNTELDSTPLLPGSFMLVPFTLFLPENKVKAGDIIVIWPTGTSVVQVTNDTVSFPAIKVIGKTGIKSGKKNELNRVRLTSENRLLSIAVTDENIRIENISIYTATGKLIIPRGTSPEYKFDRSGVYIIHIQYSDGLFERKKVLIQ